MQDTPPVEKLTTFCDVLLEFYVRFRHEDGSVVTQSTMLRYIRGLNHGLKLNDYPINLFEESLFTKELIVLFPFSTINLPNNKPIVLSSSTTTRCLEKM